ncbi:outer membrane protein, partial [Xanthomonas vesicatoria]
VVLAPGSNVQFWDGAQTVANGSIDGGSAAWTAGGTNWTSIDGLTNDTWQNSFAVFAGTAGTVGVQGTQGITGMQFVTDGYVLSDGGAGGLSANAANTIIRVDPGVTGTIDVAIGGAGALQKLDTGTLVLDAANSYTGGTSLGGGTLVLGDAQALGTGALTAAAGTSLDSNQAVAVGNAVILDGALNLLGSNDLSLSGPVSGAGGLIKNGTSTLTLTGNNSYVGGTVLNAGTLAVGSNTALGSGPLSVTGDSVLSNAVAAALGNAVNLGAALTVDNPADLTLAGAIGGSGALIKTNTGTLTLDGGNTYTGGTTVNAGTLAGNSASLQGAIVDNATVVFNQAADGVFSGSITGTGNVVKDGAGALLLNGANGYSGGTTIAAGSLIGDSTSVQGDIVNNAALVFNQTTGGVYAGVVSGTGSLEKAGSGTLQLTGANSYTGGTLVSAGSLIGTTDSLQGDVVDNATLVFDQAADGTFTGVVSGTGTVVKQGAGALTLAAANTYSGGTTVAAGTLQGTTTSLQGNILDNAVLVFDQADDGSFAGSVSGSGALIKNGTGAVTLDGANTYLGGTTINAGTLIGNTGSLQGDIVNNSTLTFLQNSNGTYAGRLLGVGRFVKLGTGTLLLTANSSSFTGPTEVNAGTLSVGNPANPGAAIGGPVSVGPGGTLTGSGSIGSLSTSGGTVAIGGGNGTIGVGGDATIGTGSTLQVTPGAGGVVAPLAVGGAATVAPGSTLVLVRAADLPLFTEIPVINAAGGLTGQFTNVFSDYAFIDPNVSTSATGLSVSLGRNTVGMVDAVTTPNQQSTAAAVDGLSINSPVYQAVVRLPDDPQAVATAFASLSGESHASTATAMLDSRFLNSGIGSHLRGDSQDTRIGDTTVWITGRSLPNRVDGDANAISVRREDNGIMAGAERRIGERTMFGVAVGSQDIESWSREWGDRADIDGTHVGVYGQADWSAFSLQGAVDYADYSVDGTRRVMLPGVLEERLSSEYDATAVTVSLEASWNLRTANAVYSPFIAADYTHLKTDGFVERGGIAGLSVDSAKDEFTTSTLGVRGRWELGQQAALYASVGWRHAFGDRAVQRSAGFIGTDSEFSVQSVTLAKNAAIGELGVSLITSPNSRMSLSLQGLDGDGQTAYGGQVTWGWSF